jgi:hypothetical protein
MLIGKDFEKVEVDFFGLTCVEPNAMLGDGILFLWALFLAWQTFRLGRDHPFFKLWSQALVVFGISFLAGGLGHFFFNYWGVPGKYFGWMSSVLAVYFLERAMISIYPIRSGASLFGQISKIKLVLSWALMILQYLFVDLNSDPQKGLLIPSISSAIGIILCLGILARRYQLLWNVRFQFFWMTIFIMIPSALFQALKINIHPLFDRNDFSHVLLALSLLLYWKGIEAYSRLKRR